MKFWTCRHRHLGLPRASASGLLFAECQGCLALVPTGEILPASPALAAGLAEARAFIRRKGLSPRWTDQARRAEAAGAAVAREPVSAEVRVPARERAA